MRHLGEPAELRPRFILLSAVLHVAIILTAPPAVVDLGRRPMADLPAEPSEAVIMRVMEIATQSLVVGNYSASDEEAPALPPEDVGDIEIDDLENPPLPPPVAVGLRPDRTGQGSRRAGLGRGQYQPPVPVIMTWPTYPSSARRRGIRGTVLLRVHVTTRGDVDRAEVVSGLEDEACRRSALDSARGLRFLPALLDGKPIDAWFSFPVEFGRGKRK